ncbi:MAG: beta-propeller domain-containing protein [Bacilli bacterium]
MKKTIGPKLKQFMVSLFFLGMLAAVVSCKTDTKLVTKTKIQQVKTKAKLNELMKDAHNDRRGYYDNMVGAETPETDATGDEASKGRDFTGTNEQVEGVSEADVIKTDGYQIYYLARERGLLQIFDVADDKSINLSKSLEISDSYGLGLYLLDKYVVVISEKYTYNPPDYEEFWMPGYYGYTTTAITVIERINHEIVYELNIHKNIIIDHRVIGNNLFLIGYDYLSVDAEESRPKLTLLDGSETYIGYNDIYYFDETPAYGITKVIGLKLEDNPQAINFNAKGYLGASYGYKQIYVSQNDLYLCDSNYIYDKNGYGVTLTISQFALDLVKADVKYVAAGIVDGMMLNQFSMDYYKGYLRVATTDVGASWKVDKDGYIEWDTYERRAINHLYVLETNTRTQTFKLIGHLSEGLGKPDETIKSVRFLGDTAYIVTFLNTDPLYIIDLSDPANPVITDDIELPGFDVYQHPFGDSFVLGLGYSADDNGWTNGVKLTAYNTTAGSAHEIQTYIVSTYVFEELENGYHYSYAYTEALWDHKAMLISVKDGIFAMPLFEWSYSCWYVEDTDGFEYTWEQSWVFEYQIYDIDFTRETPIAAPIKITHPAVGDFIYPVNRSVLIEGVLYIFSTYHVSTYDLSTSVSGTPIYVA